MYLRQDDKQKIWRKKKPIRRTTYTAHTTMPIDCVSEEEKKNADNSISLESIASFHRNIFPIFTSLAVPYSSDKFISRDKYLIRNRIETKRTEKKKKLNRNTE